MKNIKIIALLLFICLLFAACSSDNPNPNENENNNNADNQSPDDTAEPATEIERPDIPDGTNYGGYKFRALVPDVDFTEIGKEIYAEEEIGDTMNDAVYKRNRLIENMLNIDITTVMGSGHWLVDFTNSAVRTILAGEDAWDIIVGAYQPRLAFGGCLVNLYDVPNMDLTKPWWDQRMIEDLSFRKNRMHYIIGDIGYYGMSGVSCTLFNKQLFADNGFEYPYEKVRQGKWTLDEYTNLVRAAARDLNGDGVMDENDQWGAYGNSGQVLWSMLGCGENIIALDQTGVPFINSLSDRHIQVVTALGALTSDKNIFLLVENMKVSGDPYDAVHKARENGQFLFFSSTVAGIPEFRDLEYDFGVLPSPKFDGNQLEYRSPATSYSSGASSISVPVTNSDLERAGMILEAMSGYSTDIIIPALMDVALKSKFTRDEESAEMIELVLKTKFFDGLMEYGWGNITWGNLYWDVYSQLTLKGADTFVSSIEKNMEKAEQDTVNFIDTFDGLGEQ